MKECAKTMLRNLRRDAVAQAIADMLVQDYSIQDDSSPSPDTQYVWKDSHEHQQMVRKIRKVMDQTYAKT